MSARGFAPRLWQALRVGLGLLFLMAAAGKLGNLVKFMGGIDNYGLVHGPALPLGAVVLPGIELLCALCLLLGWQVRAAGALTAGMLLLFVAAMGSALARHLELDCSCFDLNNADPALLARGPLLRDLALTGLALAFQFLSTQPAERPRVWRLLLALALFAWTAFSLLGAAPALREPLTWALAAAALLWLALDLLPGLRSIAWGRALGDALLLALPLGLVLHLLGDGQASLGWGTILRDVAMAAPALWLTLYGPEKS